MNKFKNCLNLLYFFNLIILIRTSNLDHNPDKTRPDPQHC